MTPLSDDVKVLDFLFLSQPEYTQIVAIPLA